LRKVTLAILALSFLIGMAATALAVDSNISFNFDQSVQGSGYFMTYRYIQLHTPDTSYLISGQKGPMYKDYAHGSGTIDNEITICAEEVYTKNKVAGCYYETEAYSCISAREDNAMVYSPMTMSIGNGYYARNPIRYDSLLKEKTEIKNYRPVTSMHHQVEYAKAVDKEIDVIVKDKQYTYEDPVYQGVGYTSMKINEDVTDGMVHIGVLQGEPNDMSKNGYIPPETSAWRNPMVEIDEDYVGTFHIEKNMSLDVPYKKVVPEKDWLSCCIVGCEGIEKCGPYNPCEECMGLDEGTKKDTTESLVFEPTTSGGCCGST
jgi:hypothetical protein